jgi:hypothetical protein
VPQDRSLASGFLISLLSFLSVTISCREYTELKWSHHLAWFHRTVTLHINTLQWIYIPTLLKVQQTSMGLQVDCKTFCKLTWVCKA